MPCRDYDDFGSSGRQEQERQIRTLKNRNDELARLLCEATGLLVSCGFEAGMSDKLREHFSAHRKADIIDKITETLLEISDILSSDDNRNKNISEIEKIIDGYDINLNQLFVISAVVSGANLEIEKAAEELYNQNEDYYNKKYIKDGEFNEI